MQGAAALDDDWAPLEDRAATVPEGSTSAAGAFEVLFRVAAIAMEADWCKSRNI